MKEIKYKDEEYDVAIFVRRATLLDGMERSVMIASALRARGVELGDVEAPEEDAAPSIEVSKSFLELYTFPNCVACTSEVRNAKEASKLVPPVEDLTFEEFINLPEQLAMMWVEAAVELNPRWAVGFGADESGEGNEPDSKSGSTSDSLSGSSKETKKTTTPTEKKTTPGS